MAESDDDDDRPLSGRVSRNKRNVSYVDKGSDSDSAEDEDDHNSSEEEENKKRKKVKTATTPKAAASTSKKESASGAKPKPAPKAKESKAKAKAGNAAANPHSTKLKNTAVQSGMLSIKMPTQTTSLKPSKDVQEFDGLDLVKKSGGRKKFLFLFPGVLSELRAGQVGNIEKMDTQNPVIYMDWGDQGRLKLVGTIANPKAKLLSLKKEKLKGSESVVCDHIFETLVVFSQCLWIGKAADNPEEKPLPFPSSIRQEIPAKKSSAKKAATPQPATGPEQTSSRRTGRQRKTPTSYSENGDDAEDSCSDDSDDADRPSKRRHKKAAAGAEEGRATNKKLPPEDDDDAQSSGSDILERMTQKSQDPLKDTPGNDYAWGGTDRPGNSKSKSPFKEPPKFSGWDSASD